MKKGKRMDMTEVDKMLDKEIPPKEIAKKLKVKVSCIYSRKYYRKAKLGTDHVVRKSKELESKNHKTFIETDIIIMVQATDFSQTDKDGYYRTKLRPYTSADGSLI